MASILRDQETVYGRKEAAVSLRTSEVSYNVVSPFVICNLYIKGEISIWRELLITVLDTRTPIFLYPNFFGPKFFFDLNFF